MQGMGATRREGVGREAVRRRMKGSETGNSSGWNGAVTRPDTLKERGRNVKPLKGCERASNSLAVRKRLQHRLGVGEKFLVLPADAQ